MTHHVVYRYRLGWLGRAQAVTDVKLTGTEHFLYSMYLQSVHSSSQLFKISLSFILLY
jgi:hypothetical protein